MPDTPSSHAPGSLIRSRSIGGGPLVRDYLADLPQATKFYSGSPFRLSDYVTKTVEVSARFSRENRGRAAAALRAPSGEARARLEKFVADGGFMVTTGQQTGFLTGPLYTIYKALSAVALAHHLEEHLGKIVIPVFWIASEDHDWAEVNHAFLLDPAGQLRRFELGSEDERPLSMSRRTLVGDLETLCDEVTQFLGGSKDTSGYVRRVIDPFRGAGKTVGAAFGEAISALLGDFGICFADASDPELKEASKRTLAAALLNSEEQERSLRTRTAELEAAGYRAQVPILEGGTNVFLHDELGRERLYARGNGFGFKGTRQEFSAPELLASLDRDPVRFSPNVLLRPLVESTVFPTVAYVGGPGELAYFAQAAALFELEGRTPPIVVPRFSGVVVEEQVSRSLHRLELGESDLSRRSRDELVDLLARRELPVAVADELHSLRSELAGAFDRLGVGVREIDPTLVGSAAALRDRLLLQIGRGEQKILKAVKRRESEALRQLDRVLNSLRPLGGEQDRILNVLPYLARYGDHFLRSVYATIQSEWRLPLEDPIESEVETGR